MPCLSVRTGALVVVLTCAVPSGAAAQASPAGAVAPIGVVRVNADGTVSINAAGLSVQAVLEQLRPVCAMELRFDEKTAARPVTLEIANLPPAAAVREVLKASGLDFAMNLACGTPEKPMRVVAREAGSGPLAWSAPPPDPDDPQTKAVQDPPLPAGPPPEPEKRDEDPAPPTPGGIVPVKAPERELAPGELTGSQIAERLAPQPRSTAPVIELPFTDANGRPYLQVRPPDAGKVGYLPFPDANGNLVVIPIPDGPRPQKADFPVVRPDAPAAPVNDGPKNPGDARRPGGGGR